MNLYLENHMECDQEGLRSSYVLSSALFSKSGQIRRYTSQIRKSAKQGISPERATNLIRNTTKKAWNLFWHILQEFQSTVRQHDFATRPSDLSLLITWFGQAA